MGFSFWKFLCRLGGGLADDSTTVPSFVEIPKSTKDAPSSPATKDGEFHMSEEELAEALNSGHVRARYFIDDIGQVFLLVSDAGKERVILRATEASAEALHRMIKGGLQPIDERERESLQANQDAHEIAGCVQQIFDAICIYCNAFVLVLKMIAMMAVLINLAVFIAVLSCLWMFFTAPVADDISVSPSVYNSVIGYAPFLKFVLGVSFVCLGYTLTSMERTARGIQNKSN